MSVDVNVAPLPDVAQVLSQKIEALPEAQRGFAGDLIRAATSLRGCSAKQGDWLRRLARSVLSPAPVLKLPRLTAIRELFAKAGEHLKRPRVMFEAGALGVLRLTKAGETSRYPEAINVTTKGSFEDRTWFGRIMPDGTFHPNPRLEPGQVKAIADALTALAANPAKVAATYGHKTGQCCFCGLELTDRRSVEVGYGPICAESYGLPWGS